uniref:Uncharacterized protein n=1 Tax=Brassica oleracea var. oleracea TaxID=109376 RepID=A0A0D3CXZ8_BRAOL
MGSSHLNGQETVPASQDESRMQVSGETSLLNQNLDEFLAEEKDDILSDDSASVSDDDASIGDFGEEEDISNNEDYLQIEDVDALEANNENQKKHEPSFSQLVRPYTMNLLFHNYSRSGRNLPGPSPDVCRLDGSPLLLHLRLTLHHVKQLLPFLVMMMVTAPLCPLFRPPPDPPPCKFLPLASLSLVTPPEPPDPPDVPTVVALLRCLNTSSSLFPLAMTQNPDLDFLSLTPESRGRDVPFLLFGVSSAVCGCLFSSSLYLGFIALAVILIFLNLAMQVSVCFFFKRSG